MKRAFDLFIAAAMLLFLCPGLVVIAGMVVLGDGGSPFFRGWRVGLSGKPFRIPSKI